MNTLMNVSSATSALLNSTICFLREEPFCETLPASVTETGEEETRQILPSLEELEQQLSETSAKIEELYTRLETQVKASQSDSKPITPPASVGASVWRWIKATSTSLDSMISRLIPSFPLAEAARHFTESCSGSSLSSLKCTKRPMTPNEERQYSQGYKVGNQQKIVSPKVTKQAAQKFQHERKRLHVKRS